MTESTPPLQIKRALWHTRVQTVVFLWFAAAALVAVVRFDDWHWFLVHFLMLGAVSNALFIWSWHFTGAVLRVPDAADRADEIRRLLLLNLGVAGTVIGVRAEAVTVILASVAFVVAAVAMHARAMRAAVVRALPSPYAFTVHVYIAACGLLVPGLLLGAWMELLGEDDALEPRLVLAHVSLNLLGWVGMPILGTIVTLWPTMLRTRIAPNAALLGRKALPMLVVGTVVTAVGLAAGFTPLAVLGLAAYLAGFLRTLQPMVVVMRAKKPASYATWTALAGIAWLFAALLAFAVRAIIVRDVEALAEELDPITYVAVVGVLQVLVGCMSYLIPSMAAGGPAIVRLRNDIADAGMVLRFVLANAGAVVVLLPIDSGPFVGAVMLGAGLVWSLVRIAMTIRTPSEARVAGAEAARVWVDDKEVRPYPFGRR